MVLICGIDDAGRGPVIGPLVMAGVSINQDDEDKLIKIKVKDSKLLTPKQRSFLYGKIIKIVKAYKIVIIPPEEVDQAVQKDDGLNLNWLEANKSIDIIHELKPDIAILDSPSNNLKSYRQYIEKKLKIRVGIRAEHKADVKFPVVSAASILAKVTRDSEIEKLQKKIKEPIGSGYSSDPVTQEFLKNSYEKYPGIFRHSWFSYKDVVEKKFQKTLTDFGRFLAKEPPVFKEMAKEDLKELEKYGYKQVPAKTEYESIRLKGACTVTLYKSGKLLIQGRKENKEIVGKILRGMGYREKYSK